MIFLAALQGQAAGPDRRQPDLRKARQVVRVAQRFKPGQAGSGHQHRLTMQQAAGNLGAVFQRPEADAAVEAFLQKVRAAVEEMDLQRHLGMPGPKSGGDRTDQKVADHLRDRQPQMPARSATGFAQGAPDILGLAQQPVGTGGQHLTLLRRAQGAGGAFDEPDAKAGFQVGNALRQGGFRHPQRQRGGRKRAFAQNGAKAAQGREIEVIVHDAGYTVQYWLTCPACWNMAPSARQDRGI